MGSAHSQNLGGSVEEGQLCRSPGSSVALASGQGIRPGKMTHCGPGLGGARVRPQPEPGWLSHRKPAAAQLTCHFTSTPGRGLRQRPAQSSHVPRASQATPPGWLTSLQPREWTKAMRFLVAASTVTAAGPEARQARLGLPRGEACTALGWPSA